MGKDPLHKIGEVARLLGTTPRTLRFYEEEGLVSARRTPGGTRLYADADIARFRAVLRLAQAGIPIALIKELASTRERFATGSLASREVQQVLARLADAVRHQIELQTHLQADLSDASAALQGCSACENPPTRQGCPSCPLNRLASTSQLLSLIWEQELERPGGLP
jgi:DNA-binding transcriptional MerR regulator